MEGCRLCRGKPCGDIEYNRGLRFSEITAGASLGAVLVLGDMEPVVVVGRIPMSVTSFCPIHLGLDFYIENFGFCSHE